MTNRQKWKEYFETLNRIYNLSKAGEILISNEHDLVLVDDTFNRQFRGVVRVKEKYQSEIEELILHAKDLLSKLTKEDKLPRYFPIFIDDFKYMTVKNRLAVSSRKYVTGQALLSRLFACDANEFLADSAKSQLDEKYGKDFVQIAKAFVSISVSINVEMFKKYHNCDAVRVREETCDSYYCLSYPFKNEEPIRSSLGFKLIRFDNDMQVFVTPKRKKRAGKYDGMITAFDLYKSRVYAE